jgi:hypothetical protein
MFTRHVFAACAASALFNSIRTSFSACTKVSTETSGPTGFAVPNAGGIPAGSCAGTCVGFCSAIAAPVSLSGWFAIPSAPTAAPSRPIPDAAKNSRRVFTFIPPVN